MSLALMMPVSAMGGDLRIESARSAGPSSITGGATVMGWDLSVIESGNNGWFCLPDNADTPGNSPLCGNEPWLSFLKSYMKKEKPAYTGVGISYMLQGDWPVSNTDPYASGPTQDNQWSNDSGPHLMVLVPDLASLKGISTDPNNGGPFVMWAGTDYAHIMVPIQSHPK
ncbi:MAG: hypothetical protein HZA24_01170 [Nitrospirae bacterium]|nr:hypothetical protein [Nitrospirota bacterium]